MSYYPLDDLHGLPKPEVNLEATVCNAPIPEVECDLNPEWPCARQVEGGRTNQPHFLAPYLPPPNRLKT